jgi:hypothetical protein
VQLSIEAERAQSALSVKVAKVKEDFLETFRAIASSSFFQGAADGALKLAGALSTALKYLAPIIPLLTVLAAAKIGANIGAIVGNYGFAGRFAQVPGTAPPRIPAGGFARGGVVPGHGNTDSHPAMLMPGEFVVRKDSAQKIGYGTLNRLNQGGMRRYASGGSTRDELIGGISSFYSNLDPQDDYYVGYRKGQPVRRSQHALDLADASFSDDVVGQIPSGSEFLGSGLAGLAFRGPDGKVRRVQPRKALRLAREVRSELPLRVLRGVLNTKRPNVNGLLQAESSVRLGRGRDSVLVETLPYARPVSGEEGAIARDQVALKLRTQGYELTDAHFGNLGEIGGRYVATDPGSVGKASFNPSIFGQPTNVTPEQVLPKTRTFAVGGGLPSLLMPGEFVLNRDAAARLGGAQLDTMNKHGRFASGGWVGMADGGDWWKTEGRDISNANTGLMRGLFKQTGLPDVDFGKLVNRAYYVPSIQGGHAGIFDPSASSIAIGNSTRPPLAILTHEFGHAFNSTAGNSAFRKRATDEPGIYREAASLALANRDIVTEGNLGFYKDYYRNTGNVDRHLLDEGFAFGLEAFVGQKRHETLGIGKPRSVTTASRNLFSFYENNVVPGMAEFAQNASPGFLRENGLNYFQRQYLDDAKVIPARLADGGPVRLAEGGSLAARLLAKKRKENQADELAKQAAIERAKDEKDAAAFQAQLGAAADARQTAAEQDFISDKSLKNLGEGVTTGGLLASERAAALASRAPVQRQLTEAEQEKALRAQLGIVSNSKEADPLGLGSLPKFDTLAPERQALVMEHYPLVKKYASSLSRKSGLEAVDDLEGIGGGVLINVASKLKESQFQNLPKFFRRSFQNKAYTAANAIYRQGVTGGEGIAGEGEQGGSLLSNIPQKLEHGAQDISEVVQNKEEIERLNAVLPKGQTVSSVAQRIYGGGNSKNNASEFRAELGVGGSGKAGTTEQIQTAFEGLGVKTGRVEAAEAEAVRPTPRLSVEERLARQRAAQSRVAASTAPSAPSKPEPVVSPVQAAVPEQPVITPPAQVPPGGGKGPPIPPQAPPAGGNFSPEDKGPKKLASLNSVREEVLARKGLLGQPQSTGPLTYASAGATHQRGDPHAGAPTDVEKKDLELRAKILEGRAAARTRISASGQDPFELPGLLPRGDVAAQPPQSPQRTRKQIEQDEKELLPRGFASPQVPIDSEKAVYSDEGLLPENYTTPVPPVGLAASDPAAENYQRQVLAVAKASRTDVAFPVSEALPSGARLRRELRSRLNVPGNVSGLGSSGVTARFSKPQDVQLPPGGVGADVARTAKRSFVTQRSLGQGYDPNRSGLDATLGIPQDEVGDKLAQRAALRSQGIGLDEELGRPNIKLLPADFSTTPPEELSVREAVIKAKGLQPQPNVVGGVGSFGADDEKVGQLSGWQRAALFSPRAAARKKNVELAQARQKSGSSLAQTVPLQPAAVPPKSPGLTPTGVFQDGRQLFDGPDGQSYFEDGSSVHPKGAPYSPPVASTTPPKSPAPPAPPVPPTPPKPRVPGFRPEQELDYERQQRREEKRKGRNQDFGGDDERLPAILPVGLSPDLSKVPRRGRGARFADVDGVGNGINRDQFLDDAAEAPSLYDAQYIRNPAIRDKAGQFIQHGKVAGFLRERVAKEASDQIDARGGRELLSDDTTKNIIGRATGQQSASVERELSSAQQRLIRAIYPSINSTEARKKAEEDVARALNGEARVVRDKKGRILGTEGTVNLAADRGVVAPGAGGASLFFGGVSDRIAGIGNNYRLANEKFGNFLGRYGLGQTSATAALLATPYIASGFNELAGTADNAVATGNETSYVGYKGVGGLLQGGVLGATVGGSIGGPIAGAAGAVVGGLAGLVNALKEAEKEIRQVKINNALTTIGDRLTQISNQSVIDPFTNKAAPIDPSAIADAQVAFQKYTKESISQNVSESHKYFGIEFDPEAFTERQRKSARQDFGGQLPTISKVLQVQAESLGRENPQKGIDNLLDSFKNGQNGLNTEYLRIIATVRGVSLADVVKEFKKNIQDAQRVAKNEQQAVAAQTQEQRSISAFGSLLLAVQGASDSLTSLQRSASILHEVFSGSVGATKVSGHADNLQQFGRGDQGALEPLELISKVGGDQGKAILESGKSVDAIRQVLPSIIAQAVAKNPGKEEDVSVYVREQLEKTVGQGGNNRDVINSVIRSLNEETSSDKGGLKNLRDKVQSDSTGFSDRLLATQANPIKDFGSKIAKELEQEGNRVVDGLVAYRQQVAAIGETRDRQAVSEVSVYRQSGQFAAERLGRRNQSLDLLDQGGLEYGFRARQERLAGVGGAAAFDPAALGARLRALRPQIQAAAEQQQVEFDKNPAGAGFRGAAENLIRLKDQAANLQEALKHLTDTSERTAVAQEKLAKLNQEEEGRLGAAEKFATASPEEQLRLNRGVNLANQAANAGNLNGFVPEDRKLILETLSGLGSTTLTGFKGAPQANDLRRNLLANSFGGVFQLTPDQQKQKGELQADVVKGLQAGADALKELASVQKDASDEFFRNMGQQQGQFFQRLSQLLIGGQIADRQLQVGGLAGDQAALQQRLKSKDVLSNVGIIDDTGVQKLRDAQGDLEALVAAKNKVKEIQSLGKASNEVNVKQIIAGNIGKNQYALDQGQLGGFLLGDEGALGPTNIGKLQKTLSDQGFTDKDLQTDIVKRYSDLAKTNIGKESKARGATGYDLSSDKFTDLYEKALAQAINESVEKRTKQVETEKVKPAREALDKRGLPLVTPENTEDFNALVTAIKNFDGINHTLGGLDKEVQTTSVKFAELNKQIADLQAQLKANAGPVPAHAAGGFIYAAGGLFVPKGTDTVPAMLTPGEFVVNRESAQANSGLLATINSAKGPVYRAEGGILDHWANWQPGPPLLFDRGDRRRKFLGAFSGASGIPSGVAPREPAYDAGRRQRFSGAFDSLPAVAVPAQPVLSDDVAARRRKFASAFYATGGKVAYLDDGGNVIDLLLGKFGIKPRKPAEAPAGVEVAGGGENLPHGDLPPGLPLPAKPLVGPIANQEQIAANRQVKAQRQQHIDLEDELRFQARLNPLGDSSLLLANRRTVNEKRNRQFLALGLQNIPEQRKVEGQIAATAASFQHAASLRDLAKRQGIANAGEAGAAFGLGHADLDAQRGIAAASAATVTKQDEERFLRSPEYRRYLAAFVRSQTVRLFASGGQVGTDSVPALLTPGEVVMNTTAVNRVGAGNLMRFNKGGMVPGGSVQFLADGGNVQTQSGTGTVTFSQDTRTSFDNLSKSIVAFNQAAGGLNDSFKALANSLTTWNGAATALTAALNNMPRNLTGDFHHDVVVTLNGAEALAKIVPGIEDMVTSRVNEALRKVFGEQLPDAGVQV